MVRTLPSLAALALLALALVSGCEQSPGIEAAAIIGSIFIEPGAAAMQGGTEYHVWLVDADTVVDPLAPEGIDAVTPVAWVDGAFPGTESDWYTTINYLITDVPAGTYFALAWIDHDASGSFNRVDGDYFGFYDTNATGMAIWTQPDGANVVVPETGLLDIDIWCSFYDIGAN